MKKRTRLWLMGAAAVLLLIVLAVLVFSPKDSGSYENLIVNGDFEQGDDNWLQDAYVTTTGYTAYEVRPGEGRSGSTALYIRNDYLNDARFVQEVEVAPSTLYHLHGYIRGQAESGLGANLSVDGVYVFSDLVYDAGEEWQEVSLYGMTGEKQTELKIFVRLGGYSGESTGEAWFDDVTLCRVDDVPDGYIAQNLFAAQTQTEKAESGDKKAANLPLLLSSLLYLLIAYALLQMVREDIDVHPAGRTAKGSALLLLICALGLLVRILLGVFVRGYDVDVNDFMAWAMRMAETGPAGFYVDGGFCDYPPGYMLVLWLLGGLGKAFGGMSGLLVKAPAMLCDLGLICLLYRFALRHGKGEKTALALAAMYAFNPLVLTAGAAWGQVDSVMTLLLCLVVMLVLAGNWRWALPVYMLAVLMKPQALMFGPLGLIALIMAFVKGYRQKEKHAVKGLWMQFAQGMALLVMTAAVIVTPFSLRQGGFGWLFELYGRTMSHYAQATVNSCNLYFLLGLNWVHVDTAAMLMEALAGVAVLCVPCIVFAFAKRQPAWLKCTAVCATALLLLCVIVLDSLQLLTYGRFGTLMIAAAVMLVLALYVRTGEEKHIPLLGATLLTVLFTLGTMMHERYLFPALALLLLSYVLEKDKRILWLMLGMTVACLFNVGAVLDRNMRIGGASGHLSAPAFGIESDLAVLEYLASAGSLLLSMASIYLSLDVCRKAYSHHDFAPLQREKAASAVREEDPAGYAVQKWLPDQRLDWKDAWIMGICTVLFTVLTLTNLGSVKAPQQGYAFTAPDEAVIFDLGEEKQFNLLYYGGIHYSDSHFSIEVSRDGEVWEGPYTAEMDDSGDCFKWKYAVYSYGGEQLNFSSSPLDFSGRYVRLTADHVGLTLFEVLARDGEGHVLPMEILSGLKGTEKLIDEQDTLEGEPGWYNSTYFDEIYHARTAYEHLHGMRTYEWTHPPLGKVLMSWSVALFGMTPFGWRFAGAMMGVFMLPGMYLLGRMLFKKRFAAVSAMLLMAFDFMHFTQTRIATIDSFVVCFIIWSVYFMLRYMALDFWCVKSRKTYVPLALSGLFMGFAVASKWTGCYAGVGLAILFFWAVWRRFMQLRLARRTPAKQREDWMQTAALDGGKRIVLNVLSCFVFFVAVPLGVYVLSYIPHFAHSGGVTIAKILDECERMLGYHGTPGLGMDHPFYSPWYQWPLSIKPMFYFSSSYEPEGLQSTIMSFGNPAVWWMGALALVLMTMVWALRHVRRDGTLSVYSAKQDAVPAVLLLCFLAQYLPWVLVPRGTYIYHYFTAVPFVILATVYMMQWLDEKKARWGTWLLAAQVVLAAGLFVAFFPYISGVLAPQSWLDAMKWFPGWIYY